MPSTSARSPIKSQQWPRRQRTCRVVRRHSSYIRPHPRVAKRVVSRCSWTAPSQRATKAFTTRPWCVFGGGHITLEAHFHFEQSAPVARVIISSQ